MREEIKEIARQAKESSYILGKASSEIKNKALHLMADKLEKRE